MSPTAHTKWAIGVIAETNWWVLPTLFLQCSLLLTLHVPIADAVTADTRAELHPTDRRSG